MRCRKYIFLFLLIIGSVAVVAIGFWVYIRAVPSSQTRTMLHSLGAYKPDVIGFQPYWLVRSGNSSYGQELTTLSYFSLAVEKDGTIRKEDAPGEGEPGWVMLTSDIYEATLSAHRKAGVELSLVVQNMVEEDILELIAKPQEHAETLVGEVAPIMRTHGFTDLNLDIESFTTASDAARLQYTAFVRAVKEDLTRLGLGTLTVELTPKSPVEMHLIDVAQIGEIADRLVLMAYDYHYVFSAVAGPVAPVGGVPTIAEYDVETALKETLRYAPSQKVILGIPLYGYEWETVLSTAGSAVIPGSWQLATGGRIEPFVATCTDCIKEFDPVAQSPYVIFPGETPRHYQQVFYENKQSLQAKIALAEKYQLAGVALWAVGYESEGMLAPITAYKNSIRYRGFGTKPDVPYTQIQPASLTLSAPTHALVGTVATFSGVVKKMGRQDTEYQQIATAGGSVVQGESLAGETDGLMHIIFPNTMEITLGSWGEVGFSELVAPSLALRQKGGTVVYRLISTDTPWSIRVLRTLVVLKEGEITVMIDADTATVEQNSGSSLLGNIDADNVTATYDLLEGQTATINQIFQTLVISGGSREE